MTISKDSKDLIGKEIEKVRLQKLAVKEKIDALEAQSLPWKKQLASLNSKIEQLKNDIK